MKRVNYDDYNITNYLEKHKDTPNRTLAKIIQSDHPELKLENLRYAIRKRRNSCNGRGTKDQSFYSEKAEEAIKSNVPNPFTYLENFERKSPAKILLFDIETAPLNVYVWSLWKQNVGTNQIISDWFCLSWSAKWLFEEKVHSGVLKPSEVKKQDDTRIIKKMWSLLNQADIVIAHNGDKFDHKRLRTRFLKHRLNPPSPFLTIDTLKHARNQFAISSNRLDYIGEFLGVGRKIDTGGFELWDNCMKGCKESLRKMQEYCDMDVILLERVYLEMRPYIKPHPNVGLYVEENINACPSCGSDHLLLKGTYATTVNLYDSYQCGNCGSWSRSRRTLTPLKNNLGVKSSIPK